MKLIVSNINPASNELPFITLSVQLQDTETLGQGAIFYLAIDKDDALLSEIQDLAREKVKEFLSNALREIDFL